MISLDASARLFAASSSASDLMMRARLYCLGKQEHVLLLVIHHVASDGWSNGVLFRELSILYEAFAAGKQCPLSELALQYADFPGITA